MNSYLFVIDAKPNKGNENYDLISTAEFQAWVVGDSIETAEIRVCSVLRRMKWIPKVRNGYFMTEEQLDDLEPLEDTLYNEAMKNNGFSVQMTFCSRKK